MGVERDVFLESGVAELADRTSLAQHTLSETTPVITRSELVYLGDVGAAQHCFY